MSRRFTLFLSLFLLLTFATPLLAQTAIEGLGEADLALLAGAGGDADTLHADLTLRLEVQGEPEVAMELLLAGPMAAGADDAGQALMTMDLAGETISGAGQAPPLLQLRLVDEALYLRMSDEEAWQGMRLDEEGLADAGLPADMGGMAGAGAIDLTGWLATGGLGEVSRGTRLADEAGLAHFRIEVDLDAWLASPGFAELMGMTGTADDESLVALLPMMAMFLQDLQLVSEVAIQLDSGLMQRMTADLGLGVNPAMVGGSAEAQTTTIAIALALENMRYDEPLEVSAPEAAGELSLLLG